MNKLKLFFLGVWICISCTFVLLAALFCALVRAKSWEDRLICADRARLTGIIDRLKKEAGS
jgi:hypothetical protein